MANRVPIFWDGSKYLRASAADDVLVVAGFSGDGSALTDVNAQTLDSLDSAQFLRSDVADTMEAPLTFAGFDGAKIVVKATAADETAVNVKIFDVQTSANVSMASLDSEGDLIVHDLQVNGVETVVDTINTAGLTVDGPLVGNGAVTLGDGDDAVAVNAGSGNFTVAAANMNLSSGGVLTDLASIGLTTNRIPEGFFTNLSVTNFSATGADIDGTVSQSFTINSDNATADGENCSLVFDRGTVADATITWNSTTDKFVFSNDISVTGDVAGTTIGGILQANLLDLDADETITGQYTFPTGPTSPVIAEVASATLQLGIGATQTLKLGVNGAAATIAYTESTGIIAIDSAGDGGSVATVALGDGIDLTGTATGVLSGFGSVKLPSQFHINDIQTSTNVTATNLNTLTAGAASDADALHTHNVLKGNMKEVYTASGAIAAGDVVYSNGNNTVAKANAGAIATARAVGIAEAAINDAVAGDITLAGVVKGIGTGWTAGGAVYVALTSGAYIQDVSGYTTGQVVQQVGIAKNATDLRVLIGVPLVL